MRYSKRFLLTPALLILCAVVFAHADDNIAKAQNRLKTAGCYFGNPTGALDSETAAALTRYQVRHGLAISGKLDAPTARALHVSVPGAQPTEPTPQELIGSWRRLPNGEMQFVEEPPPPIPSSSAVAAASPASSPPPSQPAPAPPAEGPVAPARVTEHPAPSPPPQGNATQPPAFSSSATIENPERFRDYVEAFVQAGLARPTASEIKFFAESVDYFGTPNVSRAQIQRDLVGYNQKWPRRKFWIDGNIQIQQQSGNNEIKLVFPLRYELRNGSRYATGRVLKSLTLLTTANNEMQIVAVSEWTAP